MSSLDGEMAGSRGRKGGEESFVTGEEREAANGSSCSTLHPHSYNEHTTKWGLCEVFFARDKSTTSHDTQERERAGSIALALQ